MSILAYFIFTSQVRGKPSGPSRWLEGGVKPLLGRSARHRRRFAPGGRTSLSHCIGLSIGQVNKRWRIFAGNDSVRGLYQLCYKFIIAVDESFDIAHKERCGIQPAAHDASIKDGSAGFLSVLARMLNCIWSLNIVGKSGHLLNTGVQDAASGCEIVWPTK